MIPDVELDKFEENLKAKIVDVLMAHRQLLDAEQARKKEVENGEM